MHFKISMIRSCLIGRGELSLVNIRCLYLEWLRNKCDLTMNLIKTNLIKEGMTKSDEDKVKILREDEKQSENWGSCLYIHILSLLRRSCINIISWRKQAETHFYYCIGTMKGFKSDIGTY